MEEVRHFTVELKTFIFSKAGVNKFHITERNRHMALFLLINGAVASWVVKMVVKAIDSHWREGFFKKLRVGNGALTLQHHIIQGAIIFTWRSLTMVGEGAL